MHAQPAHGKNPLNPYVQPFVFQRYLHAISNDGSYDMPRVTGPFRTLLFTGILFLSMMTACTRTSQPVTIAHTDLRPGVHGHLYVPDSPGPHPGVILLHGASGIRKEHHAYARTLSERGYVTLILDYYAETGGAPAKSQERLKLWPSWQETVRNSVRYVRTLSNVIPDRIGILGFSRGAFLAVGSAGGPPGVEAVVEYYGGGGAGSESLEDEVRDLPPVLIVHGDADEVIPVSFAERLRDAIDERGGKVEIHIYPGARHAFNLPSMPHVYDAEATIDARTRTLDFLDRYLKQSNP